MGVTVVAPHEQLFPVFLKLSGRRILVVGAGAVATGKIRALVDAGAAVDVVAPDVTAGVESLGVQIRRRAFRPDDLDGAWMVIAAAPPEVNRAVAAEAERRRVFVNAVDDPDNASAYLGGVVRRAGVTFAISTDGRAPAIAGILREGLDAVLPETDLALWMREADRLKQRWRAEGTPMESRRPALLEALLKRYERPHTDDSIG